MDTRREFLKKSAILSGGAGVLGGLHETIQRALAIDPDPGTTCFDADHVVILMQENRSFDHCYGSLQGVRGFDDPRAIALPNGNPVWLQTNAHGETYAPFRLDLVETKATWMGYLPHTWESQVDARNEGKYDHWLDAKRSERSEYAGLPLTLGYYTRQDIPFYYDLADAFTVCDQHFCSSLTGTMPNRLFFWSGTNRGDAGVPAKVRNQEIEYESSASWTTFPERLEAHGISWKIYQNELSLNVGLTKEEDAWLANYGDNPLEWFTQYRARFLPAHRKHLDALAASLPARIAELEAQFTLEPGASISDEEKAGKLQWEKAKATLARVKTERAKWSAENFESLSQREKNLHEKAFATNASDPAYHELAEIEYQDGNARRKLKLPKGDILHQFREDVDGGQLPTVSWLVAPENFSDHPSAPWYGAWYVSEVLEILTRNPAIWKKTVFILTYDENDGYFDHAPPFVAPHARNPRSGLASKGIDTDVEYVTLAEESKRTSARNARESPVGLGYRVPLVIASPWSRGGQVCSQVFDHTSTLQFLEKFVSKKAGRTVEETNISAWRRAICGDLTSAFRPHHGEKCPTPPFIDRTPFMAGIHRAQFKNVPSGYRLLGPEEIEKSIKRPSACPWMPRQEPGVRPSCALPYQLSVNGKLDRAKGAFTITFAAEKEFFGEASAGSPFTVYALGDYRTPDGGWEAGKNWAFAVSAGDRVEYDWPLEEFRDGNYHLQAHGPNGFMREFRGGAQDPLLDIEFKEQRRDKAATGAVEIVIANSGGDFSTIEIADRAYGNPRRAEEIPPGGGRTIALRTEASFGWYDFSIFVRRSEACERRYAGRVETGESGFTDPVIGRSAGT